MMANQHLLKFELLPADVRLEIFEHLFSNARIHVHGKVAVADNPMAERRPTELQVEYRTLHLNILGTARLIRTEALQALHNKGIRLGFEDRHNARLEMASIDRFITSIPQVFKDSVQVIYEHLDYGSVEKYIPFFPNLNLYRREIRCCYYMPISSDLMWLSDSALQFVASQEIHVSEHDILHKVCKLIDSGAADDVMIRGHRWLYAQLTCTLRGDEDWPDLPSLDLGLGSFQGHPVAFSVHPFLGVFSPEDADADAATKYSPYSDMHRNYQIQHRFAFRSPCTNDLDCDWSRDKTFITYDYDTLGLVSRERCLPYHSISRFARHQPSNMFYDIDRPEYDVRRLLTLEHENTIALEIEASNNDHNATLGTNATAQGKVSPDVHATKEVNFTILNREMQSRPHEIAYGFQAELAVYLEEWADMI